MDNNRNHIIRDTNYLHFGPDGLIKGVTGFNEEGEFTVYKDFDSKNKLVIDNKDLYYTGDRICLGDTCLAKHHLDRISSFFNIKLGRRISDNFYKENALLIDKEGKTVNDIVLIVRRLIKFYKKLLPDEKKSFIKDTFHNEIKLPKLGIKVDQYDINIKLMNMIHETDINISRIENKVGDLSILGINKKYPHYEIIISDSINALKMILFYDDMKIRFTLLDYYMLRDLELQYFSRYREKNLEAITQVDSISIPNMRPHDLKILIDNLKSLSLIDGMYMDKEYIFNLSANNSNIDVYKLDALLYFPNSFEIKEFNIGEYESIRDSIDKYLRGSLISKYIYLGIIDNYEVRLIKGEKNNELSSKWKIYFKKI